MRTESGVDPILARHRTVTITCWIVGFFVAIWIVGFVPASAIATLLYLKFGAGERWPVTVAIGATCWLFFFGLFDYALQLPFPDGALFDWLPAEVANMHRPDLSWGVSVASFGCRIASSYKHKSVAGVKSFTLHSTIRIALGCKDIALSPGEPNRNCEISTQLLGSTPTKGF